MGVERQKVMWVQTAPHSKYFGQSCATRKSWSWVGMHQIQRFVLFSIQS
jgi:hypothetical protein